MRWLIVRTITISAVILFLLMVVRWMGSFRKNPAAEILGLDAGEVARSCWHKICPGQTTFAEAESLLRAEAGQISNIHYTALKTPSTILCWDNALMPGALNCAAQFDQKLDTIADISFNNNTDNFPVDLGDVVSLLGTPIESHLCLTIWPEKSVRRVVLDSTAFADGSVLVDSYTPENLLAWRVDPMQKVHSFEIAQVSMELTSDARWKWRGFVSGPREPIVCGG